MNPEQLYQAQKEAVEAARYIVENWAKAYRLQLLYVHEFYGLLFGMHIVLEANDPVYFEALQELNTILRQFGLTVDQLKVRTCNLMIRIRNY